MDKNIRICIVGGGPAGLSAGMYLEQKGYENYTILERLDRVGGHRKGIGDARAFFPEVEARAEMTTGNWGAGGPGRVV